MRILLLGDYSNVHNTLAKGFRALGHECFVASDGDKWKDYPRDIDLKREFGLKGNVSFMWRLLKALPKFRGFDVVQLVNPLFLELKAEKIPPFYNYIRKNNKKVILGAFGMDYYWADVNSRIRPLRYSDFNFGDKVRMDAEAVRYREEWVDTPKGELTKAIAKDCDGIVAGLYEYWATYNETPYRDKMQFIPFPVEIESTDLRVCSKQEKVSIFVGVSRNRSAYKGTDIMIEAAKIVRDKYPDIVDLRIVEGVPFNEYQRLMNSSDMILDQLYSYTPAMNSLLAMSKGIINVGGGEPENYDILHEDSLRPIVNVEPTLESCVNELESVVVHREMIPEMKRQSVEYVRKHHDYIKVAKEYLDFYEKVINR